MAKWGKVDFEQFKKLRENLQKLSDEENSAFCEACCKELAARLLAYVIPETPVRDTVYRYKTKKVRDYWQEKGTDDKAGKKHYYYTGETKTVRKAVRTGGTLKRGWTANRKGSAAGYAQGLQVTKNGNDYVIEVINPVEYASYVEFGHRTRDGKGWVPGKFMLTISEEKLRQDIPGVLEKKLRAMFKEAFDV